MPNHLAGVSSEELGQGVQHYAAGLVKHNPVYRTEAEFISIQQLADMDWNSAAHKGKDLVSLHMDVCRSTNIANAVPLLLFAQRIRQQLPAAPGGYQKSVELFAGGAAQNI